MPISRVFSHTVQVPEDHRLQPHATPDRRTPEFRHSAAPASSENWRGNARSLSWARVVVADWWPLFAAGVAIALLF